MPLSSEWRCTVCSTRQRIPSCYATLKQPSSIRCVYCGEAHHIDNFNVTNALSPAMMPLWTPGCMRLSPWRMWSTRPARSGWYEVRFNTLQDTLTLWWSTDRRAFLINPGEDSPRVITADLQGWRGMWSN